MSIAMNEPCAPEITWQSLPFTYGSFLSALANIFSMECKGSVDDVKG